MGGRTHELRGFIESRDHALMRKVHRWRAPAWFRWWMIAATRGGDGWLWLAIGLALVMTGGTEGARTAAQSTLAGVMGVAVFLTMKRLGGRRRPCALEPHCWSKLLPPDRFSFPSGHTITAFSVVMPMIQNYPGTAAVLYFLAGSVAISRIVLGMHFLSDVLAGAVIGMALGKFTLLCF